MNIAAEYHRSKERWKENLKPSPRYLLGWNFTFAVFGVIALCLLGIPVFYLFQDFPILGNIAGIAFISAYAVGYLVYVCWCIQGKLGPFATLSLGIITLILGSGIYINLFDIVLP